MVWVKFVSYKKFRNPRLYRLYWVFIEVCEVCRKTAGQGVRGCEVDNFFWAFRSDHIHHAYARQAKVVCPSLEDYAKG